MSEFDLEIDFRPPSLIFWLERRTSQKLRSNVVMMVRPQLRKSNNARAPKSMYHVVVLFPKKQ
jgi:hypothetical protein